MLLGAKIAKIRNQLGETQEEFAERFGKKQSTVASWENNSKSPRTKDLFKIAQLANTTVEDLLGVSEKYEVHVKGKPVDEETQRVISDLTRRIVEASPEEKKVLLRLLKGIADNK